MYKPNVPTLTSRIKVDVMRLIRDGTIPATVSTFSELHDYCDANCFGGLCDEPSWWDSDNAEDTATMNAAQDAVNLWLQAGGHRPADPKPGDVVTYLIGSLEGGSITPAITGEQVQVPAHGLQAWGCRQIVAVVGFNPAYKAWVVRTAHGQMLVRQDDENGWREVSA